MGTTPGGTPYAESTDTLPDWPATSEDVAQRIDVVASGSMVRKTADYTVTVADVLAGRTILVVSATAKVITLPSSGLVNGMTVRVVQGGAGGVSFTGGTLLGSITTLSAPNTGMNLVWDATEAKWWCLPFSGNGQGAGTGGTESTLTNPDGDGKNYKLHAFTSSSSFVATRTGFVRVLGCGAGGTGNGSWEAAGGGECWEAWFYVVAGVTYTVTIGATAASGSNAGQTSFGSLATWGGGMGGSVANDTTTMLTRGANQVGGHRGSGTGANSGGGATGNGSGSTRGAGRTSSITGTSVDYARGGSNGTTAPSNPGDGGARSTNTTGQPGVLYVRYEI